MTRKQKRKYTKRSPKWNDSVRVDDKAMPVKEVADCQLPERIRTTFTGKNDSTISKADFIRAMKIASQPFIPVRELNKEAITRMAHQTKAEAPSIEDIEDKRL